MREGGGKKKKKPVSRGEGGEGNSLRLLEFLSVELFFRLAMLKVENQLPSLWLPKLLKVLLLCRSLISMADHRSASAAHTSCRDGGGKVYGEFPAAQTSRWSGPGEIYIEFKHESTTAALSR